MHRAEPKLEIELGLLRRKEAANEAEPSYLAQAMGLPAGAVDRSLGHGEVVEAWMLGAFSDCAAFGLSAGCGAFLLSAGGVGWVIAHGYLLLAKLMDQQENATAWGVWDLSSVTSLLCLL